MTLDKTIENSEDAGEVVGMYLVDIQGVCGTDRGNGTFISGERGKKGQILRRTGEQRQY